MNHSGIYIYMSLPMDPYRYVVMTSMKRISSHLETVRLIKKRKVISSITGEYVSSYLIPGLCENPCAINHALYLIISLFSLHFLTNTHLYPICFIPLGVWTTCPKTYRFINYFNYVCITYFHFGQSFMFQHFSTFCGSESS